MKKRFLALVCVFCLLLSGCVIASAAETPAPEETACLHENAAWELLIPATLVTESYYTRTCPDCGFKQTAKKARTSLIERAFDVLARCFFIFENPELSDNFSVTAHTGPGEVEQNSMFSLRYSLQSGADIVEFDLALNSDGTAVMAHDDPDNADATLDEGFAAVAGYVNTKVNVDVKNINAVAQAQELAIKYGILDRIFYTGISNENETALIKENSPLVPYYLNISAPGNAEACAAVCDKAAALGAVGLNFNYNDYSPELAAAARERGLLLSVYTVNSAKDLRMCLGYDIDNITTEFPYKLFTMTAGLAENC